MGRKILYIANYYLDDVIAQRNSKPFISQAAQNKSNYMIEMFKVGGNSVTIWSNAWTSSHSGHFYKGFQSKLDENVFYSDILGIPFLNVWTCKRSCKKFFDKMCKRNKFDAIVFYNMRLENAPIALYAKKKYNIPIYLQYEDGLTRDANIKGLKKWLYGRMERRTLPKLDGAFLVTSKISVSCPSLVVRGAIRENEKTIARYAHEKPILLFSSTLDRQRGAAVLIDALKYTKKDFTLIVTGRGELEKMISGCQDERVDYRGYIDYEEYRKLLGEADICINSQLSHAEFGNVSFPSKIFEYLSSEKLVISSDVADAKETIGEFSFIYDHDDPKKLAQCIDKAISVLEDKQLCIEYQKKIKVFIQENSIEKMAEKANQLLDGKLRNH